MRLPSLTPLHYSLLLSSFLLVLIIGLAGAGYHLLSTLGETQERLSEEVAAAALQQEEIVALLATQGLSLSEAQAALDTAQEEAQRASEQVLSLQEEIAAQPKDIVITSADLSPYLTSVIQLLCVRETGTVASGSGTLWTLPQYGYAVLTNHHVVRNAKRCIAHIPDTDNDTVGVFALNTDNYTHDEDTDTAILALGDDLGESLPLRQYNYAASTLRTCPTTLDTGTPVVAIGFPAYARRNSTVDIPSLGSISSVYRATTNGIVSGFDTSNTSLAYQNFFVSAKIDSGNSGGLALAKDEDGLCVLGIPTWLSVGNYETQGLVQNILNVVNR